MRFYDLMTPVGSDQRVGLSVASCEFTSAYAKPECDSTTGLVVGMETHFWIHRRLQRDWMVDRGWVREGGGSGGGVEDMNPTGHYRVNTPGIQL